ncbi:hypothetical protein Tco_0729421 [Tanacetum coccineum]|uniref:Uncharacterized protein n=1 Tax=Tanacetum coccineum TaxID=301880 RepID=A0ABQ4YRA2_9ASTR
MRTCNKSIQMTWKDLRWQIAMLTMRAKRFLKNTRMKLAVNGNETIVSPKWSDTIVIRGDILLGSAPKNQDNKNKKSSRRSVPVETVTPPKWVAAEYDIPGVLLHRSTAQDMRTTSIRVV